MAQSSGQRNGKTKSGGRQAHLGPAAEPAATTPIPAGLFALGVIGLSAAVIGSGLLVWQHLSGLDLPGCGPGSGCAEATASNWGSVPGLGWPTSHVGLAFFIALLFGWLISRAQNVSSAFLWLIRLGAIGSVVLTLAMFDGGYVCKYCLLAHGGNLLFWLCAEMARRGGTTMAGAQNRAAIAAVVVFALATIGLIPVELLSKGAAEDKAEQQLVESTENIIHAPDADRKAFTGRYLLGPEKAAIRIVALTDYQCPDCRNFETELREVMKGRDDISLSVKQFPMSTQCNPYMNGHNMHPNACMAARAAEAAGILRGQDAFWKMHFWLFDEGGIFTDESFPGQLRELGYDPQEFVSVMTSKQTEDLVKKDIEEGVALGLFFTPMVFINGVELRGAHFKGNLTRAIERITAEQPPAMSVAEAKDTPPTAEEKYVEDWELSQVVTIPPDANAFPLGDDNPKLNIIVWGDYQESGCSNVNSYIRRRMKMQNGIHYTFRHYPIDLTCNEYATQTLHGGACMAARAVEAAGMLGGSDAWWSMHESMFLNSISIGLPLIGNLVDQLNLDREVHLLYMDSDRVDRAITEDALAGKQRGLNAVPWVFMNGKRVTRLTLDQQLSIGLIFDEVLGPLTNEQKAELARQGLPQRPQPGKINITPSTNP